MDSSGTGISDQSKRCDDGLQQGFGAIRIGGNVVFAAAARPVLSCCGVGDKQLIQLIRLLPIFKPEERARERNDLDVTLKAVDNDELVVLDQNLITK
ncbi:hypothetical protein AB3X55_00710 [Alphaproteobacteria bacterium LSUCC0719]